MFLKRNSYLMELTLLDFILINFRYVVDDVFSELNELALKGTNLLVIFQARINLVLINPQTISFFEQSENFPNSIFYYRLLNSLLNSEELSVLFKYLLPIVETNINNAIEINNGQKLDLLNMINKIIG